MKDKIHVVALLNVVTPETFNELLIVDAPETNKLVKLVLFNNDELVEFKLLIDNVEALAKLFKLVNIVVLVAFKLLIDNVEALDKEFKLVNIVVDVACKFGIFNAEYVDKLFKFVLVAYNDKSGLFVTTL